MQRFILFILATLAAPALLMAQSKGVAKTEDIFDINAVNEVRLFFKEANWDQILDSLKQRGYDQRLVGDATYNGKRYEGVGVRYKGNSSYFSVRKDGYTKLPFNIDFNHTDKSLKLPGGYDKMKLSNVFRDPSFIREVLSYEIARRYMPAPRANFIKLYVNDTYLGLYNNTESVEDDFLERYYHDDSGILFKCDPIWGEETLPNCKEGEKSSLQFLGKDSACYMSKYEIKSGHGWKELIELAYVLNYQTQKLDSIFNIDQALWMLAFNSVLVNLDSYTGRFCHNYYLYRDQGGAFQPIIWDLNLSFGGFRYDGISGSPLTNQEMQELSPFQHYKQKNEKRPLITNLLGNGLYRKMYLAHIRTIVNDYFVDSTYLRRGAELQALIDKYVKEDNNKLYTYEAFKKNLYETTKADKVSIVGIAELMGPRTQYLSSHPLLTKEVPLITAVESLDFGDIVAIQAKPEGAEMAWLFYRYGAVGAFYKVEMFDDSGHNDAMAQDGIWGATIDKMEGKEIEYYVVAENQYSAALYPERASFEFLTAGEGEKTAKKENEK
ncbi:MAG: CotH kinase family protein [Phaeodactylibacter sp.]|nr:CotH kinase family protein [Phaeodactylibacter sp.]MCB9275500.1 CotH kinase family protein [Lewinellaceae bacterium]